MRIGKSAVGPGINVCVTCPTSSRAPLMNFAACKPVLVTDIGTSEISGGFPSLAIAKKAAA
ncbi:unannotated protein [freshwater metagenome]|uniref:Unannotated protein n=1 Tax=freshwater metagenome TaxID=449393 RepID=A0A6J7CPM1_9ZZZZ